MRFERLREESIDEYFKSIGDAINTVYEKYNHKINGVVVGGPGPTKENFVRSKNLNYQIKVLGTFDIGSTDENAGMELKPRNATRTSKRLRATLLDFFASSAAFL